MQKQMLNLVLTFAILFLPTLVEATPPSSTIKVFILNCKFRLTIQYLTDVSMKFEMDFFGDDCPAWFWFSERC